MVYEEAPDLGPPQAAACIRTYDVMEAEGIYDCLYQQEGLDPPSKGP